MLVCRNNSSVQVSFCHLMFSFRSHACLSEKILQLHSKILFLNEIESPVRLGRLGPAASIKRLGPDRERANIFYRRCQRRKVKIFWSLHYLPRSDSGNNIATRIKGQRRPLETQCGRRYLSCDVQVTLKGRVFFSKKDENQWRSFQWQNDQNTTLKFEMRSWNFETIWCWNVFIWVARSQDSLKGPRLKSDSLFVLSNEFRLIAYRRQRGCWLRRALRLPTMPVMQSAGPRLTQAHSRSNSRTSDLARPDAVTQARATRLCSAVIVVSLSASSLCPKHIFDEEDTA